MREQRTGRVIAAHGKHFLVEAADGRFDCVTRGKKGGVACGDQVEFKPTGEDGGVIESIVSRRTLLYRSDRFRSKLLAANIDQVFIVTAAVPTPDPDLLNRCLIATEAAGIPARILVNKTDLPETADLIARLQPYAALGYPLIHLAAALDPTPLQAWLHGKVNILVGASGVGKSTLINALVPAAEIATREISEALDTGRHTTTDTRLYQLDAATALIDSPGMQEFGLRHVDRASLQAAFPEFRALVGMCRFHNCHHLKEPDCAILAAVADGRIMRERWRTFRALGEEFDAAEQVYARASPIRRRA